MRALFDARKIQIKGIRKSKGAVNCFGHKLTLGKEKDGHLNVRQILAIQAQSVELKLMHSIFEVAETAEDFKIMFFIHDSIFVHFTRREDRWKPALVNVIECEARKMGIITNLQWKS